MERQGRGGATQAVGTHSTNRELAVGAAWTKLVPYPTGQGMCRKNLPPHPCADSGRLRDEVKQPSISLDVRVDIHQAVAIEESNMLALVDGRPARMQRLGLFPISA
jgi:hypothetical protein